MAGCRFGTVVIQVDAIERVTGTILATKLGIFAAVLAKQRRKWVGLGDVKEFGHDGPVGQCQVELGRAPTRKGADLWSSEPTIVLMGWIGCGVVEVLASRGSRVICNVRVKVRVRGHVVADKTVCIAGSAGTLSIQVDKQVRVRRCICIATPRTTITIDGRGQVSAIAWRKLRSCPGSTI
jgi:hypothetical protein